LPTSDIGRIVYTYRQWRGEPKPDWWKKKPHGDWKFVELPGFAKPAKIDEIAKHGHVLTPGRYVGAEEMQHDGESFAEKFPMMVAELEECFREQDLLTKAIRKKLKRVYLGGAGDA